MKQLILSVLFLHAALWGFCQKPEQLQAIDSYLKETIIINDIPGLAVGIVKNNTIIFQRYYGTENLESTKKVDSNSLFRVYSTSKLISTVGVFQLVEKGKISLEDKISKHLDNLPEAWQAIKVKHLLTHSSGLPDIVRFRDIAVDATPAEVMARLSKEKMQFETGNQFSYNQTNYWLLTLIIEKVTGQTFEDFIVNNQFPDSRNEVLFSSNSVEQIPNRVVKYNYNATAKHYEKVTAINGRRAHSANGLAITLPAFLKWSIRLNKNELLKAETKKIMWEPFDFTNKKDVFAYGWDINKRDNSLSYSFSGGNVSAYRIFPDNDIAIIFMSNGYKYNPVYDQLVSHLAGLMDERLTDPYLLSGELIIAEFLKPRNRQAEQKYQAIKVKNPEWNFETTLNSIGYILIGNERLEEAIAIFELNAKEHPNSANAFDSLGEGYFKAKNYALALEKYKKTLELDPQNINAKKMIEKIEDTIKN